MPTDSAPLAMLRYHVSGAVARGESQPITAVEAPADREELSLCDCCASMVANGDESACRHYYGHTHRSCDVPFSTVILSSDPETGEGNPVMSPRGFTCDGCQTEQGAYANEWGAVVL